MLEKAASLLLLLAMWFNSLTGSQVFKTPDDRQPSFDIAGGRIAQHIENSDPGNNISPAVQPGEDIHFKPYIITDYPAGQPASEMPVLMWTVPPGSVYFEIELLTDPPENPNGITTSTFGFHTSRQVYTSGYCIDLSTYPSDHLYWRVRGLDLHGNPVGVFSDAASLYIDHNLAYNLKPVSTTGYRAAHMPMPLYPVYAWIPIPGAASYEVEVTNVTPENPNGIYPSQFQIRLLPSTTITDCYDPQPLSTPGTYYWRVRGLDESGAPVGVFSDAEEFTVPGPYSGIDTGTLGDSITHGGGAISFSPACVEYSYQHYLAFPVVNLGMSGDTTATMVDRFEADVLPFRTKFLIIMGGTNSLRDYTPAGQVIKELAATRDKCIYYGIRPIFLTLPPINPDAIHEAFNEETAPDWQSQFAAVNEFIRRQDYYIDLEPYFVDDYGLLPSQYGIDGMHLDIEGKKMMAQIIDDNWARVTAP